MMAEASDDELAPLLRPLIAFLPSEEEVRARFPHQSLSDSARALARLGSSLTVIKRGPTGAVVYDARQPRPTCIPAVPVRATDPTGAGDSFCGGFLAGLVQGGNVIEAAVRGAVAASFVVEDFSLSAAWNWTREERDRRYRWIRKRVSPSV
jgi:ribokinase